MTLSLIVSSAVLEALHPLTVLDAEDAISGQLHLFKSPIRF